VTSLQRAETALPCVEALLAVGAAPLRPSSPLAGNSARVATMRAGDVGPRRGAPNAPKTPSLLKCYLCLRYKTLPICPERTLLEQHLEQIGTYGSNYSDSSPWNRYATSPPVIVDEQGNFYGYLTANVANPKRTRIAALVALTDASDEVVDDPAAAADAFCGR
jgi:hypothetical protein